MPNFLVMTPEGFVGVGGEAPPAALDIPPTFALGPISRGPGEGRMEVSGHTAELGFWRRSLSSRPASPAPGDRFVWYNPDGSARLWTEATGDLLNVDANGSLHARGGISAESGGRFGGSLELGGELFVPSTTGAAISIGGHLGFFPGGPEEARPSRLRIIIGSVGLDDPIVPRFAFEVCNTIDGDGEQVINPLFSVNQNGDIACAGSKSGYVVDYFVNQGRAALEQGDVVVIESGEALPHYGSRKDVPIPRVVAATRAHDRRVCGIAAYAIDESNLPPLGARTAAQGASAEAGPGTHPYLDLAAAAESTDPTRISPGKLGRMVTLGAYAYCKVDADITPVEAGDLLTTSSTPGHAQKVMAPSEALGAIVGKALAPLAHGKGKIPVLVSMQ